MIGVATEAIEAAAVMLGADKSRGYGLEMICADFLAGDGEQNHIFSLQSTAATWVETAESCKF